MTKNKYTKLEIELYENLAKIYFIHDEMIETFRNNVPNYANQNKKEMGKWVLKIVYFSSDLRKVLDEAKIPKKFLILNKL